MNEERRQLLADMARVQALYLLRILRETDRSPADLMATQTPWRGQLPAPGMAWPEFVRCVAEILLPSNTVPASEPERVKRFVEFADPLFAEGLRESAEAERRLRWFGSFRFGEHPEQAAISLHIANRCSPRSPFEDLEVCFGWLRDLCAAAEALPFPLHKVICGTWLNDRSDFLRLFPASYAGSLQVSSPDEKTGGGWWGQLVDRRGQLHWGRAAQLLETGQFPHPRKAGCCASQEFQAHVADGAGGAAARLVS